MSWLSPKRIDEGRRNFLQAVAAVPLLAASEGKPESRVGGKPVRAALIGVGGHGRVLLGRCNPAFIDLRAICDINPGHATQAVDLARKAGYAAPTVYDDHRRLLAQRDLEAVIIATPLWTHAPITLAALAAGKHVLCEKMMAYDVDAARRVRHAAAKARLHLEVGHQRFYNPVYTAAYEGIIIKGLLGDVYFARMGWHRSGSWRREEAPPSPGFDATAWGYPSFDHLLNWRLYRRYSQGLMAELGSHQVAVANWFLGATPLAVQGAGAIARYQDGREVNDHVHVAFEYPQGRTATYTSIQSNQFHSSYEEFLGTKGTLILRDETEALFFPEGGWDKPATKAAVASGARAVGGTTAAGQPDATTSASRKYKEAQHTVDAPGGQRSAAPAAGQQSNQAYRDEIIGFCAAIRGQGPLACGPDRAFGAAAACISANQAMDKKARVEIPT